MVSNPRVISKAGVVLRRPVCDLTLKMASAQVVETSANVITNRPSQDYTHPDDHTSPTNAFESDRSYYVFVYRSH